MAECCPFINRADERCSGHFNLDGLERAFADCVGDFVACPHHEEMMREREERAREREDADGRYSNIQSPVQVTVAVGIGKRFAAAA
ncbi:MAG TPA: hypothetical protein VGQ99_19230 [Tepidisphaeraceae bacterium]|jgi:hypothetical protein|nr:hypothetical protein [Tepidisphaeraceae bacterium]